MLLLVAVNALLLEQTLKIVVFLTHNEIPFVLIINNMIF